ncbi:DNA-binding transcriptional regulator AraC [bacterium BMS3Abin03]|nr:DNA-binding transcriptional regulator AraC [bacterium BMS3Abin03]
MDDQKNILFVKNMVCGRCIRVVREDLENLGVEIKSIILGEVETAKPLTQLPINRISETLQQSGFELIEDNKAKIIEKIKKEIISAIQQYEKVNLEEINFSSYLSDKLNKDYPYLSYLFSKTEGITIEHFVIMQKIEKAKEFLKYGELTLSEIAYWLGYSSVQHLSRQFKNITGFTASQYKSNINSHRKSIDKVI